MHVALQVYHGSRRLLDLPRGGLGRPFRSGPWEQVPNADLFDIARMMSLFKGF